MSKKKINIKLSPGQAAFVADIEILQHIAEVYETMAFNEQDKTSKDAWINVSLSIKDWIEKTYIPQEDIYDEEW
jgi:hypothetical protein